MPLLSTKAFLFLRISTISDATTRLPVCWYWKWSALWNRNDLTCETTPWCAARGEPKSEANSQALRARLILTWSAAISWLFHNFVVKETMIRPRLGLPGYLMLQRAQGSRWPSSVWVEIPAESLNRFHSFLVSLSKKYQYPGYQMLSCFYT